MHCSNTSLHLAYVWFCVQLNFCNIFLTLQKHCYFKSSAPLFSSQTTYFRSVYSSLFTRVWLIGEQLFTDVLFACSSLAALANFYCLTDHSSLTNKMHTQKGLLEQVVSESEMVLESLIMLFLNSEFLSLGAHCSLKAISPVMGNLLFISLSFFFFPPKHFLW